MKCGGGILKKGYLKCFPLFLGNQCLNSVNVRINLRFSRRNHARDGPKYKNSRRQGTYFSYNADERGDFMIGEYLIELIIYFLPPIHLAAIKSYGISIGSK